jgi:hypothetical protein
MTANHPTPRPWARRRDDAERGEGVISAAIAVLVMAFLGAAMWLAFNTIFANTAKNACEQARTIGGPANTTTCAGVGE